jgi:hypothetical protein
VGVWARHGCIPVVRLVPLLRLPRQYPQGQQGNTRFFGIFRDLHGFGEIGLDRTPDYDQTLSLVPELLASCGGELTPPWLNHRVVEAGIGRYVPKEKEARRPNPQPPDQPP